MPAHPARASRIALIAAMAISGAVAACTGPAASAAPSGEMMDHSAMPSDQMMEHSAMPSDQMMEHSPEPSPS